VSLRSLTAGSVLAAFVTMLLLLQVARSERDTARRAASAAEARALVAEAQSVLSGATAAAVENARSRELSITLDAKEEADEIAEVAGGDAIVPASVLDRWGGAIDRMRDEAGARTRSADHGGSRGAEGALSASRPAGGAHRG
jgi:hypothetical protein